MAFAAGWVAVRRLLGKGFPRVPRPAAWGSAAVAVVCVALIFVLPPILTPAPASTRPSSTAQIRILSPTPGQTFQGNPARVPIRLQLTGGHIVTFTSTKLTPDEGHVHLFVDGRLVSMSYGWTPACGSRPGTTRCWPPSSRSTTRRSIHRSRPPCRFASPADAARSVPRGRLIGCSERRKNTLYDE